MSEKQEEVLVEYGIRPDDSTPYIVERDFMLTVRFGPLVRVRKGQTVWLSKQTARGLFFAGKVSPVEVGDTFRVLENFLYEKPDGEYEHLEQGDTISLTDRETILKLLRENKIKEVGTDEG